MSVVPQLVEETTARPLLPQQPEDADSISARDKWIYVAHLLLFPLRRRVIVGLLVLLRIVLI